LSLAHGFQEIEFTHETLILKKMRFSGNYIDLYHFKKISDTEYTYMYETGVSFEKINIDSSREGT
jgi:hypothetical protein